jgi:hypothetical protein
MWTILRVPSPRSIPTTSKRTVSKAGSLSGRCRSAGARSSTLTNGWGDVSMSGMSGDFRREDEEMRRTGIIHSERQAIKMAREHLRSNEEGRAA